MTDAILIVELRGGISNSGTDTHEITGNAEFITEQVSILLCNPLFKKLTVIPRTPKD